MCRAPPVRCAYVPVCRTYIPVRRALIFNTILAFQTLFSLFNNLNQFSLMPLGANELINVEIPYVSKGF